MFDLGKLVYPIMLAQERGAISESKAAEWIGFDIVTYRQAKEEAIQAILNLAESLPSSLTLLVEGIKGQQK